MPEDTITPGCKARYIVDGHEFADPESAFLGDGEYPPFVVFDALAQQNLPGEYATREVAQDVADALNFAVVVVQHSAELWDLAKDAANPKTPVRPFHARAKALVALIEGEAKNALK